MGVIVSDEAICEVGTFLGGTPTGLHVSTGGDGSLACSAQMLLEALVGCAGVTLSVVAKALEIPLEKAEVHAEGELDFRGTLGVDRSAAVGFRRIRLRFELSTSASDEQVSKLLELTERYCVVQQTLQHGCEVAVERVPAFCPPDDSSP